VLDEPTASVDAASEAAITAVVRRLADEGRVVIMVSHRGSALAAADHTVTMDLPREAVA
jgi:ABC-type transport system involved in cytochrome bd biosynthesis fused ATPase/permease subunit